VCCVSRKIKDVLGSEEVREKRTHQEKKLMREAVDFFIQNSVKHFGLNREEIIQQIKEK
jgi:hypothetical protein